MKFNLKTLSVAIFVFTASVAQAQACDICDLPPSDNAEINAAIEAYKKMNSETNRLRETFWALEKQRYTIDRSSEEWAPFVKARNEAQDEYRNALLRDKAAVEHFIELSRAALLTAADEFLDELRRRTQAAPTPPSTVGL